MMLRCYSTRRWREILILCVVTVTLLFVTNTILLAPPVGGQVDSFLADRSPEAIAFREAWEAAIELEGLLDPPPEGVTGEQQRVIVIEAFEKAIAIMPEAPPSPDLLLRIGQLWNSSAVAPEEPAKALDAYNKVRREYSTNDRAVIQAITGQSYALWLLKRPADAARAIEELLDYQLPETATPDTVRLLHTLQIEMRPHLIGYRAEVVGLVADNGEILLPGGQKLQDYLDEGVQALPNDVISDFLPTSTISRKSESLSTKSTSVAAKNNPTSESGKSVIAAWTYTSVAIVVLGCTITIYVYRARRKAKEVL